MTSKTFVLPGGSVKVSTQGEYLIIESDKGLEIVPDSDKKVRIKLKKWRIIK